MLASVRRFESVVAGENSIPAASLAETGDYFLVVSAGGGGGAGGGAVPVVAGGVPVEGAGAIVESFGGSGAFMGSADLLAAALSAAALSAAALSDADLLSLHAPTASAMAATKSIDLFIDMSPYLDEKGVDARSV